MNGFQRSPNGEMLCKHLRCKDMYYKPSHEEANPNGAAAYWCTRTYESFGPDGTAAGHVECINARTCYKR